MKLRRRKNVLGRVPWSDVTIETVIFSLFARFAYKFVILLELNRAVCHANFISIACEIKEW